MREWMKARYEWVVTACAFMFLFVNVGCVSTSFSVYQPYLAALPSVGDVGASAILTVRTAVSLLALLMVDRLLRLFDVRLLVAISCALTGVGFVCYGVAGAMSGFVAGAVLAGLGNGLGAMVAATVLLNRWFAHDVGTAIGIASVGSGVAGVVVPMVATAIIAASSLGASFVVEGAFALVVAVAVFLVMRNRPQDMHLTPHEDPRAAARAEGLAHGLPEGIRVPPAIAAGVWAAVLLFGAASVGGMAYLAILMTSKGFDETFAAGALSMGAAFLTGSKIATGRAFDRIGGLRTTLGFSLLMVVGLAGMCLAGPSAMWLALVGVALYSTGLSMGSVGISVWSIDLSAPEDRARSVRRLQVASAVGGMLFNLVPGVLMQLTGTYTVSYVIMLAGVVVAAGLLARAYLWRARVLAAGE